MTDEVSSIEHDNQQPEFAPILDIKCELTSRYQREARLQAIIYSILWFVFFPLVWGVLLAQILPKGVDHIWMIPMFGGFFVIFALANRFARYGPGTFKERSAFVRKMVDQMRQVQPTAGSHRPLPSAQEVDDLLEQQRALPRSLNYELAEWIGRPVLNIRGRHHEWPVIARLFVSDSDRAPVIRLLDVRQSNASQADLDLGHKPFETAFQPVKLELDIGARGFPSVSLDEIPDEPSLTKQLMSRLDRLPHWLITMVVYLLVGSFLRPYAGVWQFWLSIAVIALLIWMFYMLWPAVREQVYAVPGGLVVRRSSNYARHWDLELFTHANAMLFLANDEPFWLIIAPANAKPHVQIRLNKETLQSVLNAWFSPLQPPGQDELADLT